jgi:two-component system phosphate regulon sensor histidine kinase PhoR
MMRLWGLALLRVLLIIAGLYLLGVLMKAPFATVVIGLAAYVSWHLVQLYRITGWLQREELDEAPDAPGLWGELGGQLRSFTVRDRQRERRLHGMLSEYKELTAAMPDASVVLNDNHEILWFNKAAEGLLGLDPSRDVGLRIDNLVRVAEFSAYLEDQGGAESEPLSMAVPGNKKTRIEVHLVPFGTGRQLVLFRDTTRLRQLEKVRRKFVANASHELRSPLTVIAGYLEQLCEDADVLAEWEAPLNEMLRQTGRMTAIVDDLLELSRLESSTESAAMEPVNVSTLIDEVIREARSHGDDAMRIERDVKSDADLLGVERELHSALANLAINAIKYTPQDGRIKIRWYVDTRGGHLEVEDTGIGIAKEHLSRLTERFYRVDKSRVRGAGGTGLGLAIVKHALQRHDATLQIDSKPGRGSCFSCHFPPERVSGTAGLIAKSSAAPSLSTVD